MASEHKDMRILEAHDGGTSTMDDGTRGTLTTEQNWLRMPNGTKVRHRVEGYEGSIDGLTEIVEKGAALNPDRRTQYRVDVGQPQRKLAPEADLLILSDADGLMMIGKQHAEYRRQVTQWFRGRFADDKFIG
jgi:hypothetical protein